MTNEEMCIAIQNGDKTHISDLWNKTKHLCYSIAGRYFRKCQARFTACGITIEDYRQESYFAFLQAVRAYKPDKDTLFTSYLTYPIINAGQRLICLRGADDAINHAESLDKEKEFSDDGAPLTMLETVEDETALQAIETTLKAIEDDDTRAALTAAIKRLDFKAEIIITEHYFSGKSLKQIGADIGLTGARCGQIRNKALKQMRTDPELVLFVKGQKIERTLHKKHNPCSASYYYKQRLANRIIKQGGYFTLSEIQNVYEECRIERKALESPEYILWDSISRP